MKALLVLALVAMVLVSGCTSQAPVTGDKITGKFTDDQALNQLEGEVDQLIVDEGLGDVETELNGLF